MVLLVVLIVGLCTSGTGIALVRRVPGRSDERRWHGFLILLAGLVLTVAALVPRHE